MYFGSILGLGLKREVIGDILIQESISNVIVLKEISEYILNNLSRVGHDSVHVSEIDFEDMISFEDKKIVKTLSVASLRLDAIISAVFNISRDKSASLIEQERVLVNFLPCINNSKNIKEQDLISVRGHGRVRFIELKGETKRGRCKIEVEVY